MFSVYITQLHNLANNCRLQHLDSEHLSVHIFMAQCDSVITVGYQTHLVVVVLQNRQ